MTDVSSRLACTSFGLCSWELVETCHSGWVDGHSLRVVVDSDGVRVHVEILNLVDVADSRALSLLCPASTLFASFIRGNNHLRVRVPEESDEHIHAMRCHATLD